MHFYIFSVLLIISSQCYALDNAIALGDLTLRLDSSWTIIAHKVSGPIKVIAVQISNPADEGTPDSTNLAVTIYDVADTQGMLAFTNTIMAIKDAKSEKHKSWEVMFWGGKQGDTDYKIYDCVLQKSDTKTSILIRLSFPVLPANSKDYDDQMRSTVFRVLDSVSNPVR